MDGPDSEVAEAAAIAMSDEVRGHVPVVYAALKPGGSDVSPKALEEAIKENVVKQLGPIARPRSVYIVPDLPKTRSGKIMRRVLMAISDRKDDYGDITTLANPDVVHAIRKLVQSS